MKGLHRLDENDIGDGGDAVYDGGDPDHAFDGLADDHELDEPEVKAKFEGGKEIIEGQVILPDRP